MSRIAEQAYGDRPYPGSPGFKAPGTSQEAAQAVAGRAGAVRDAVFEAVAAAEGGLTADEAAGILGQKPGYIRPRVSELAKAGRLVKTGGRRKNASGLSAAVWRVA